MVATFEETRGVGGQEKAVGNELRGLKVCWSVGWLVGFQLGETSQVNRPSQYRAAAVFVRRGRPASCLE